MDRPTPEAVQAEETWRSCPWCVGRWLCASCAEWERFAEEYGND